MWVFSSFSLVLSLFPFSVIFTCVFRSVPCVFCIFLFEFRFFSAVSFNSPFLSLSCSFFLSIFNYRSFLVLGYSFHFSNRPSCKQASKQTNKQTSTWQTMANRRINLSFGDALYSHISHIYHPFMMILGRICRSTHLTTHHITQLILRVLFG